MKALNVVCVVLLPMGLAISERQQPVVKARTAGVVVDVSVIDAKGQSVVDVRPDEFDIMDDGVPQQILTVRLVQSGLALVRSGRGASVAAAPGTTTANQIEPAPTAVREDKIPSVTAILFDPLSPEARPLARRAALAYVSTLSSSQEYAGVFLADASFAVVQRFTSEPESLRAAIERVAAKATTKFTGEPQYAGQQHIQALDPSVPPTAGAEYGSGFSSAGERQRQLASMDPVQLMMAEMVLRMENGYRELLAQYAGQSSIVGLHTVIRELAALPGRKVILYFTESLTVTSRLKPMFETLIADADRANISVYPVDAAGLRVHSKEAEVARHVAVAGAQGLGDERRGDGPWTKELENQEQILSSRPGAALGRLAKETGGFLLDNTNNLAAGVVRMQQERTTYYLIGYQPTNASPDGKFHKIVVKVKRQKVVVKARGEQ